MWHLVQVTQSIANTAPATPVLSFFLVFLAETGWDNG
jgi:hypothetical protein